MKKYKKQVYKVWEVGVVQRWLYYRKVALKYKIETAFLFTI